MSFIAISRVKYPKSMKTQRHAIGLKMLPIAGQRPGLIGISFSQSTDSDETMMYWQWQSKSGHEACWASPAWLKIIEESAPIFNTNSVHFSVNSYECIEH